MLLLNLYWFSFYFRRIMWLLVRIRYHRPKLLSRDMLDHNCLDSNRWISITVFAHQNNLEDRRYLLWDIENWVVLFQGRHHGILLIHAFQRRLWELVSQEACQKEQWNLAKMELMLKYPRRILRFLEQLFHLGFKDLFQRQQQSLLESWFPWYWSLFRWLLVRMDIQQM